MFEKIVLYIFGLFSLVTFMLFGIDKRKAVKHKWRIPESTLLMFSVPGGVGGLLGMLVFHHKTRKWKFRILVPLFAIADVAILVYLFF